MSGNGTIKFYVNNALVGSASFSGQIGKPEAEKSGTGSGSWGEPTVMAMGCNPKGNRADTGWRNGCFTAMNLYNLKIYNQTGCVASYEAKRNVGALKDLTGHNDGNVVAEDWTNEYIQLDGKDDWINLGSMSFRTNQVTLDLTMELVTLPSTYKTLMGNLEGGGVSLGLTEDYKPYMQINIGGSYDNAKATTALKKGQKVHLLGSYDGTTIRLFVDGQLVASKVHAGTLNPATGNTVMSIGSNPSGNSGGIEFTNMKVYTAHVYNKAYWDVSEKGDNSILAWSVNSNSSGAKKVYIASKGNIYANTDASYMFSNIGASSNCTATTALTNLNLLKTANTTNMYSMFWKTGYNAMTSLDLGTSFSTAKATNLEYMFQECGYKAMTSLNLRGINTSAATSMYAMFDGTGYTAMTSLNLGDNFSTANVTKMTRMFKNCGYTKMTTLTLGTKFNTAKVTEMANMFEGTGHTAMTSLSLNGLFDTTKVTNMQAMFKNCGYTAMTSLTLGSKFNTAKVTNMQEMFANTGYTAMTKLDLGDIFYTTAATNMTSMFNATGYIAMGELDLGPAFTKIAGTYSNVFTNTGKSGCIIHVAEAIYQNKNAFKLNTSSGTTISYTRGSLNLRYKTEWIVESKNANTSAKNVTIQLRGRTNNNATSVYKSNVTSTLTKDNITVYINGAEASSISKSLGTVTTSKNPTTGYNDVLVTLTLSGFEQSALQSGKNYKEWSGDISIQIAQGTLKDSYGNKNTGLNSSEARVRESLAGPFADFIAPNVAYKFADSNIDKTNKRFTMVFDIVDKYYNASTSKTLAVTDLTIKIDGAVPDWNKVTRNLTSADLSNTVNGASKVVGKRYTLTLSNLQQSTIASGASYKDYSGVITVVVPEKKVYDTSGRYNPTTTITSGVNIPTNSGTGKVVDVVDPFWQVSNVNIDHSKNQVTMTIKGTDKYYSGNSLTKDKITVLVDGETATSVTKTLSSATSITKGVQYTLTLTTWQQSSKQSGKSYLEWSGNTVIRIAAGTLTDSNGNSSKQQDFSIGLVDFIKPTITKVSATKDAANKKETIVFDVDDKYINSTMISADNIKVYMNGVEATSITKSLSRTAKTGTVNKVSKTVGYKYTLVLTNFEQSTYQTNKEYKEWSGTVSIKIVANATKDTSNNGNVDTTITGDFVDFIKPQWRLVGSPTIDHTNNRVVMTIKGTDKYFKATTLATSNIKVYVDGTEVTSVTKSLSTATDVKEGSTKVGVQYTLTLTGWEQSSKQNGKSYFEWSGNTVVKIAAGVLTDTSSNSSPETSFTIGQVDFIKPKIEKVSSSKSGGTETITFKVIDKYFNTSAKLTKDDITVLVDGETASSVSKTLSNPTEIKETVNGASKVIGHQYTMTLTNFEKSRTAIDRNREYSDWSGTVAIKVAAGKVKDTSNNTNAETTITGDFLDVIKPNVTYQFSESNIDKNGKRFTMVFDITDKYYNASTSTTLSVNDLTIKIDGAVPDWNKVTRNLTVADYSNTVYYTSNGAIKHESKVIGKRYTLTLSNLQQSSIAANASYKDYSGVVTVAIPANKVADTTGNKNNAVTITSGVNIPTNSGTGKVVDVVDPFWQVSNVNINHSTNQVTMTIKGTDKYYKASTLSRDNITVLVDGETATSVTKTLSSATSITNGVQYTLTLTTWQQSSKQSGKSYLEWSGNTVIRIAAGTMTDTNGNSSKQQDFSIGQVDFIKPMIEKVSSTKGTNNETIVFDVNDKYISTKLSAANITTLINGEVADVKTTITSIADIKGTGIHSAKTVGHRYTVVISDFNKGRKNGRKYSDWSGTVSLRIAADAVQDTSQNKNNATTITGDFVDFIKPEFTYVYSSGNIDHTNKTLTVDFTVADRYFSTSTLTSNAANVTVKLIDKNINISGLTKTITKLSDYSDGSRGKVGENYRLTIGNIQRTTETDGLRDYSGPMSITFPANMVKDTSGNANDAKTITIGVNDPGTGSQQVVDVVSPVWSVASADVNTGIVKIRVKDKYLLKTGTANTALQLTTSEIAVLVNGTESTQVTKTITSGPTLVASGSNGYDTTYEYTIKIGNIAQTTTNYIEFTPKETVVGGKAKYRDENGGNITLRIKAGAVQDAFTNTNAQQDLYVGNVDNTGPEVYDIQKTIAANGDETFVFNITDKNYDSSKVVALNELNITIDGAQFSSAVQKNLTSQTLTDSATNKVLGHQYTLKLTNMKESTSSFASAVTATTNRRVYREYSGTIRIVINSNAARDLKGNTLNTATTTITSFNDKLAPEVVYIWSNSVINKNSKTFTMIFDITDKYYSSASLAIGDLTIKIGGKTPNWSSNEVGRSLSVSDIPNAAGKGKRYTLTLSNLQKLQIKSGDKYLDYSGVVTVAIPANKVKDTSGQGNVATTLTSGITIPGGTGSQEVVDVVEPYVQKMSSTVNAPAKTASITVRISDRYFNKSTLTKDTIKVYINGTENASVKTGWSTSEETETRTEKGTTSTVHVATNYTLNISNFASDINQIKVVVPANVVKDTSENGNKQTEYIIYNVLKNVENESEETTESRYNSIFFGNSNVKRKNINNITFVSSTSGRNSTAWDVSAQGDNSIIAWYTTSNGSYNVYIGSDYEMFGNINSKRLFQYVGDDSVCTATKTITNLNLLNVSNVTNMESMFRHTGLNAMTELDLGDNFDTRNVTNMVAMFGETGYNSMVTLNLGNKFDTSNVTEMSWMFSETGFKAMTKLDLGSNFDTSNVISMYNMFRGTGYTAMTSLNLGSKFNTAKVTEMGEMFRATGYTAMTSLNLGSNFDTSKVTNMTSMFQECGYNALTSLDLGSNFDTSSVTNMDSMFHSVGYTAMTSLNLGSLFDTSNVTNMLKMFYMTGHDTLTELDLGDKFNTSKVTNMAYMFTWIGRLKTLNLGDNFDTSNVTDMNGMFWGTGYFQMTNFSLGNKFNTKNVQDMSYMFYDFANNITSLDLGDQFYTTNATNMIFMFFNCGAGKMTSLDLGPAFTKIPDGTAMNYDHAGTLEAYYQMFEGTGKTGSIVIHAPESIFQDKNNFKLNTSATTGTINWTRGTINPKYRTEWKKESATLDTTNKNIKITLRGTTNTAIAVDQYKSDVTSSLTKSNIKVYIDGVNATESLNKLNAISLGNATQTTENSRTGAKDVLQVVTLSNLEEAARQSGKSYKEWSGNIRLEIDQKTLTDTKYGNKNMAVTSTGARANHTFADGTVQNNTADKMFADYIKPEITYTYVDSDINHTNKTLTSEFILTDKYYKQGFTATNGKYDASSIIVGIDSYDKTALNKAITKTLTKVEDITDTVNGVANKKVGEKYRLVIGNLEQQGQDGIGDGYTYSGYMSLTFPEGTAVDNSGNKSPATTVSIGKNYPGGSDSNKKIVDVVDPVWEKGNINIETGVVKLRVKDKYLVKADSKFNLTKDKIKIIVNNKESTAIVKTLTGPVEIKANEEYEYTLTLSNISPTDAGYTEFTPKNPIVGGTAKYKNENGGKIALKIAAGTVTDKYGNSTKEQTIDIGMFDGTGPAIYYVQKTGTIVLNKETVIFNVTDKNYNPTNPITVDEMTVTIDGKTIDSKNLSITKATEIITNVDGKTDVVVGHQYTLEILNIIETDQEFVKANRKYRELSGALKIQINEDAAEDLKGNTLDTDTTTITDYSDIVRPEVIYRYSTSDINYTDKTFTMTFDIVDKYYDTTKPISLSLNDLTIKVDGVVPDWTKVTRGFSSEDIEDNIDGKNNTIIGKHYTLTLSGLEQTVRKTGANYADYSGVVTVSIPANKMVDKTTGNGNLATTLSSGVSIPNGSIGMIGLPKGKTVMAMGANPRRNNPYDGYSKMKAYSMKISNENGVISSFDATNNTGSGHSNSATTWKDLTGSHNGTLNGPTWGTDYLQFDGVDDWVNFGQIDSQNQVTVEATISFDQIKNGEADIVGNWEFGGYGIYASNGVPVFSLYSKEMDRYVEVSAPNAMTAGQKTKLKGVYDGTNMYLYVDDKLVAQTSNEGTSATVVDVVDPLVEKTSSSAHAINQTATLKFKVTDKYFKESTITENNIRVLVNGTETTNGITKTLTSTALTEDRVSGETTTSVQYGVEYTLTVKGFATDANQVKIQVPADRVTDNFGNGNKVTDMIVYNVLKPTYTGTYADQESSTTAAFLGNASIQRQNIDNITFVNNIPANVGYDETTKKYKNATTWDVSAQQDKSILAWYTTNANGSLKVYIGSDDEIFANQYSTDLFAYIGSSNKCTSTETITNIDLLNVTSVISMDRMFRCTGYNAMTELDLGSKFDTSNVWNMWAMFDGTGYNAMTTLNLGENFNTSKVTYMTWMFKECGYTAMKTLNLGANFNTSKVTDMSCMFYSCGNKAMTTLNLGNNFDTSNVTKMRYMFANTGYNAMTKLDLGDKFDTSNVTDMYRMFRGCGYLAMTSLNLGNKFNTSKVTDMNEMFFYCGYKAMTSLDLGDLFYTTNVTDMYKMFYQCGATAMTSLDLGVAFTKIPNKKITKQSSDYEYWEDDKVTSYNAYDEMFTGTGKSGAVIYAPESIYKNRTSFKANSTDTITAAGTIAVSEGRTINPIYKPEWTKVSSALKPNATAPTSLEVTVKGNAKKSQTINGVNINYNSNVTSKLSPEDITVYIDGVQDGDRNGNGVIDTGETPVINISVTPETLSNTAEVTHKITLSNFEEAARQSGKSYKEWSGNISIKIGGREEATSTYTTKSLVDSYGNQSMSATDETGTWVNVLHKDADVDKNTNGKMFTDFIKPEFTYRSITDTNIVHGTGRKVEVMFDVTDKYFESTTLSNLNASQITIGMDDYDETELNKAITKKLEKVGTITDTVNGVSNVTVGERYKLTITGLEQQNEKGLSDGYTYSGYMSLKFAKGTIKDKSGNLSDATTITIGKNEPGGSDTDKTVVDIVDPVWTLGDVDTNDGTIKLRVKDKFLIKDRSKFELTTDKITIYADDVVSTEIEKQISGPVEIRANEEYEYTLTLLNIKPDGDEYEEFTPKNPIVGGTAKYKKENGGEITIEIAAGAITDAYGNKTKKQSLKPGTIDGTGPEVYDIQKTKDTTNNKETFVFNVTDKNYYPTDLVTLDEISVWLDGKQVDLDGEVTKKFVGDPVEIITTVNNQERVVGHQYTLEIGSIVETNAEFVASNRKYRELSGTLEIKIATDAAKDKKGNKINPDTATITDFNDMIKPEVIYKYATSNIDKTNKIFKMEFDLVDKYCKTINNIAVTDLTIQIDGKVPDWTKVTRNLEVSDIKEPVNGTNKLIGRHYTLTLSNLEQLQVKSGDNYLDYSGVITVAIPANKMQDTTGNQNVTTTITSGVSIPAGTGSDTIVDVVDPLIEKISSTVDAPTKTATLNFKVTDKYFASSDLANGNIEILVNGAKNTTVAANNALTVVKNLTEPRTVDGKTVQVQYGIEYSLKISGFDANANQIKVRFPTKHVKDKSGNVNKQTDIMIYNVLRSAATETEVTSPFLGNTKVQRQNVDNVTFMNNIPDSVMDKSKNTFKNTNAWDASAMQDKSIIAWYNSNEVKNGTYKVYIGSDTEIFGNTDSTNLFQYVGENTVCTATKTITNLNLLNVSSVTNMQAMFRHTGYNAMTELDLGSNFDTSNVSSMYAMFGETGYKAMKTLNLGSKFNTSKVTDMTWMFANTGYKAMTKLDLGSNFDTSNVSSMYGMFSGTGYTAMTSLNLGNKFNTAKVTNMEIMFLECGYTAMASLNLGSNFDTSKVTHMSGMFEGTGYTAMTTLNLGANFDTSKVTNMSNMFNSTGYAKMASLDLKAKFNTSKVTNMSGMFASTGHELMTTLNLGANFDTSAVTDMSSMFEATGYKKMATLNLREKFNTSKVTNMSKMFKNTGFTAMTSLDLGNTFYTTAATDTSEMFNNTGATAMTILDLGPAFDRIPDTNTDMFKNTGTAALVVYAPESIYSNVTTFIANRTRN